MSLEIITRRRGDATVLDVNGRLTAGAGATQLREAVRDCAQAGDIKLLLNLAGVQFMDSTGLGALAASSELLRSRGGQLRIVNANGAVRHVFQITRLNKVFPDFGNEDEALASFAA